jgi:hypothetical protein
MSARKLSILTTLALGLALLPACSGNNDSSNDKQSSGGSGGTVTGTGGTVTSTGGSSGGTTTTSTGGTTSAQDFTPECSNGPTQAGDEIKKGVACTDADVQLCYRTCGPTSVGWKPETCTSGVYAEGDCAFPADGDYSCFAIPDAIDTAVCPAEAPQSGEDCDVPECTLCNLDGNYFDSSGSSKTGYCVCQPPNMDGARHWSCASSTAWPCPFNQGC